MSLKSIIAFVDRMSAAFNAKNGLEEHVPNGRATAILIHRRPTRFLADGSPDPSSYEMVGEPEFAHNVITNNGRDFLHTQGYSTASGVATGFCYIALSLGRATPVTAGP